MGDILSGLFGGGADGGGTFFTALILLLLLCLLLLPCIIRYLYLRTPWGMSQLMKTSYKMILENSKKAVDSLEENIKIRRLMTPGLNWNENWIRKTDTEAEKNLMRAELLKCNSGICFITRTSRHNLFSSNKIKNEFLFRPFLLMECALSFKNENGFFQI